MRARKRRPAGFSLRRGFAPWQRVAAISIGLVALIGFVAAPVPTLEAATYLIAAIIALNGMIWLMSVLLSRQSERTSPKHAVVDRVADHRPPPRITILIALYDEAETAPLLIDALNALDYPPELLDVKLVLDADDYLTGPALSACGLPAFAEILVTPDGRPRTKPRVLNLAMEFARGDIISVYDAEDRSAPDQLRRIAAQFDAAPADIACIQARLGYYNANENFISLCFEIEYAPWFDVMLPGLRRLGLPIPLGGMPFFIRRGALVDAGGWDSFNVTEDADLGIMLGRAGMKTELSDSLTAEDANSRLASWIKQRSRWLKGYLAIWITHMSRLGELLADIGLWRFIGVNVLLLSAVFGYLALPAMWLGAWALWFVGPSGLPAALIAAVEMLGDVTVLCIQALGAAACLGLWRRGRRRLVPFVLLLPLYWPLGAIAAYLAVCELVVSPSSWRKTPHGVGRIAQQMRAETVRRDQG